MTVVVALRCSDGSVVMGGDSFCGDEDVLDVCLAPKAYMVGPVGVGICGGVRTEQILERTLREVIPEKKDVTAKWLQSDLTDILHETMSDQKVVTSTEGFHSLKDSSYLLVFDGVIYHLEEDFSLWDSRRNFAAIGAGKQFALGALGVQLSRLGRFPDVEEATTMVQWALQTTATWSPWVCSPFITVVVPKVTCGEEGV